MASVINSHRSLFSFGDSFTYGTELSDCINNYSRKTWPSLVANKLGLSYDCYAYGGTGNQQIAYHVVDIFSKSIYKNRNLYVINWTWIERFDYIDIDSDRWQTIHPRHENLLAHFFYKHVDHHAWNLIRNLQIIYSTIQFLRTHDCNFFMTSIDDNLLDKNYPMEWTSTISTLQSLVRPYINLIENKNFYAWSKDKKFSFAPGGHPLEDAHSAAADYWFDKVKSQLYFEDSA